MLIGDVLMTNAMLDILMRQNIAGFVKHSSFPLINITLITADSCAFRGCLKHVSKEDYCQDRELTRNL